MHIIALGMNHKTAPVEIRERYSFKKEGLPDALKALKAVDDVLECAILTTCNRVELYALMVSDDVGGLVDFLAGKASPEGPADDSLMRHIYIHKDEQALDHLCRVSSGLDSLVLGESQIFGQVKEAFNLAVEAGTAGFVFKSLFPQVFSLVKRVHSTTEVGGKNISVSYAAIKLARTIFGSIEGRSVMILGAGEMGELTVRNLISQGVANVYVANRTFEKAVKLAATFNGIPIMFYEIPEYLTKVDIVISSLSSEGYVVSREGSAEVPLLRNGKPLVVIDISVPRSINPNIAELQEVYLYNIDDLKSVVESNLQLRIGETHKANDIIADRMRTILSQLKGDDIEPAIASLRDVSEEIRRQEYQKLVDSLKVSPDLEESIESFSKSIVGQIVHQSILKMREYVNTMKFK